MCFFVRRQLVKEVERKRNGTYTSVGKLYRYLVNEGATCMDEINRNGD